MSETATKKQKRSSKFSEEEKSTLVNAVQTEKKYLFGIFTNESRRDAWARVTIKINAVNISGTEREVEKVIKKWNDMKLSATTKVAKYWREMKNTGGGPSEAALPSPMDLKIVAVIGIEAAIGIPSAQELPWLSSESAQSESSQSRKVHCGPTAQNLAKLRHTDQQSQSAISGHPHISGSTVVQDQPFSSQPFDVEGLATQERSSYPKRKLKSPSYHQRLDDVKKSAVQNLPEGWLYQIEEDNVWFSQNPASFGELSPITICINKSLGIWAAYYGWATTSCKFLQDVDLKKSTLLDTLNRFANAVICDGISLQGTEAEGFDDFISIHQKSVMPHPKGGPPLQQRIAVRSNNCDIFLSSGKMCYNCRQRQRQLQRYRLQKATCHDRVGKMPLARAHTTRKIATIRSQQEKLKKLKKQAKGLLRDREALVTIGSEVTRDLRSVMANGIKQQPFEIRENHSNADNSKTGSDESTNMKAKFLTMDESELSWSCGQQNSTVVAAPPITSVPKVVVNLVQGYGPHQPVDINNMWTGSGTPQQCAQVQVGKGQLVTTGVTPITQQVKVKHEIPETLTPFVHVQLPTCGVSSQNSFESAPGVEDNIQKSYTTLPLVSQESESKNNGDATSAEIATPVPATPSESNQIIQEPLLPTGTTSRSPAAAVIPAPKLNLDNIQFTKINTDDQQQRASDVPIPTTTAFIQPKAMTNNLQFVGDGTKCDTMLMQPEVEQLRIQQPAENGEPHSQGDAMQAILAASKHKQKEPTSTRVAKSKYGTGDTHELHTHSDIRKSRSLADSVLVTITPEDDVDDVDGDTIDPDFEITSVYSSRPMKKRCLDLDGSKSSEEDDNMGKKEPKKKKTNVKEKVRTKKKGKRQEKDVKIGKQGKVYERRPKYCPYANCGVDYKGKWTEHINKCHDGIFPDGKVRNTRREAKMLSESKRTGCLICKKDITAKNFKLHVSRKHQAIVPYSTDWYSIRVPGGISYGVILERVADRYLELRRARRAARSQLRPKRKLRERSGKGEGEKEEDEEETRRLQLMHINAEADDFFRSQRKNVEQNALSAQCCESIYMDKKLYGFIYGQLRLRDVYDSVHRIMTQFKLHRDQLICKLKVMKKKAKKNRQFSCEF